MKDEIHSRTADLLLSDNSSPVETMNIVFFTHPDFLGHVSMPRFSGMLEEGMKKRGHNVTVWSPKPRFFRPALPGTMKKWLGYVDQYLAFPLEVRARLKKTTQDTLFVFTDNALGPWVPLVSHLPHVIHCHDFMAQESALGLIPENPTSWTGKQYQQLIYRGYSKGRNFICGSQNTRNILHRLLSSRVIQSELVYNGLNQSFKPTAANVARDIVGKEAGHNLADGYLLHIGGNQWYKNRIGVIEIYDAWRSKSRLKLPLLLIGLPPSPDVLNTYSKSPYKDEIYFLTNVTDKIVRLAYAGSSVFLFPSLAEGFGWPIAEAMASGCPVITTNEAPMTEVAGNAGFLIPRRPMGTEAVLAWADEAAKTVNKVVELSENERNAAIAAGLLNAKRFDTDDTLDRIEKIYKAILKTSKDG